MEFFGTIVIGLHFLRFFVSFLLDSVQAAISLFSFSDRATPQYTGVPAGFCFLYRDPFDFLFPGQKPFDDQFLDGNLGVGKMTMSKQPRRSPHLTHFRVFQSRSQQSSRDRQHQFIECRSRRGRCWAYHHNDVTFPVNQVNLVSGRYRYSLDAWR